MSADAATIQNEQAALLAYLAERDVPCPSCGYNLRGATSTTCPECGEVLALRVGLVEPKLFLWLAGLIPLAMTMGFGGLLSALGAVYAIANMGGPDEEFFVYFVPLTLVAAAMTGGWLWGRHWYRRLPLVGRVTLMAGCWAVAVLSVVGGVMFIS
ncbi:MAG: hypothetical protein AAF823_06155 [Planctomycetota bacterium]